MALIGLAISRGGAANLLHILHCLFKIDAASRGAEVSFDVGSFLEQLNSYHQDSEVPLPVENSYLGMTKLLPLLQSESWPISLLSRDDKNDVAQEGQLLSSLAADEKYLYVYKYPHTIYKIGSGRNNTVQGHIYSVNSGLPPDDAKPSGRLCLIDGRLYFYYLEKPQEATDEVRDGEMIVEADSEPTKATQPDKVVILVLSTSTLQEEARLSLSTASLSPEDCRISSDGKRLYLISRKKVTKPVTSTLSPEIDPSSLRAQLMNLTNDERILEDIQTLSNEQLREALVSEDSISEESEEYESSDDESRMIAYEQLKSVLSREKKKQRSTYIGNEGGQFSVEVYDTSTASAGTLSPLRSFDLRGPELSSSDKGQQYDLPLLASSFETCEFYTNGHHLVVLMPSSGLHFGGSFDLTRAKVFSLLDGSYVTEKPIQSITRGSAIAYSTSNNVWSHSLSTQTVSCWTNLGVEPHYSPDKQSAKAEFAPFTPELFLNKLQPQDCTLFTIACLTYQLKNLLVH